MLCKLCPSYRIAYEVLLCQIDKNKKRGKDDYINEK